MIFMERAAAGSLPLWEAAANTRFLPLVDKGIHGFHGPCPHRTSLRALDIGTAMPAGPRLVLLGARTTPHFLALLGSAGAPGL